jgi:DNA-binding XRE family transcriptional regulator
MKLGISVSEVAEAIGVSRATVYNWFWGSVNPSTSHEAKIADFLRTLRTRK